MYGGGWTEYISFGGFQHAPRCLSFLFYVFFRLISSIDAQYEALNGTVYKFRTTRRHGRVWQEFGCLYVQQEEKIKWSATMKKERIWVFKDSFSLPHVKFVLNFDSNSNSSLLYVVAREILEFLNSNILHVLCVLWVKAEASTARKSPKKSFQIFANFFLSLLHFNHLKIECKHF